MGAGEPQNGRLLSSGVGVGQSWALRRFADPVVGRLDGAILALDHGPQPVGDVGLQGVLVLGHGVILTLLSGLQHGLDVVERQGFPHRHPHPV